MNGSTDDLEAWTRYEANGDSLLEAEEDAMAAQQHKTFAIDVLVKYLGDIAAQ